MRYLLVIIALSLGGFPVSMPAKTNEIQDITRVVLIKYLQLIEQRKTSEDRELYSIEADKETEESIRQELKYKWLVANTKKNNASIEKDGGKAGTLTILSVEGIETIREGRRCILVISRGSLGVTALRVYLRIQNTTWQVVRFEEDDTLAVS